jgi:hypothetical protein
MIVDYVLIKGWKQNDQIPFLLIHRKQGLAYNMHVHGIAIPVHLHHYRF